MRKTLFVAALLAVAAPLAGQEKGVELGLNLVYAGVLNSDDATVKRLFANTADIAVGVPLSPHLALRPSGSLFLSKGKGFSVWTTNLQVGMPYYLRGTWGHTGVYIQPNVGVEIASGDASGTGSTETSFNFGLGVGKMIRLTDPVSLRVGADLTYIPETSAYPKATLISASLGILIFLR